MQRKTLRRWNNALHRDIGYLSVGMTIIYALSGIILNHFKSGDFVHPDYSRSYKEFKAPLPSAGVVDKTYVLSVLKTQGEESGYKSFVAGNAYVNIFLTHGTVYVDLNTGAASMEKKTPRYVIREFNLLHYNNIKKFFTWFSDLYAAGLIILAITGLFILRGRNGIIGRGAWLTAVGIVIPAIIILFYL
ncbi:MAG TPA: PepSY-associated TM helix domain-containing protein [Bacteroidales bacterium]|nr:PepSY-associated TM helix domain-containing protein [Bacteroidales bacterium]